MSAQMLSARRLAITGTFFIHGAVIGVWIAQIPAIQERFDLSKSAVGLLLACMAIAVVAVAPVAGQLLARYGSRWLVIRAGVAQVLALNLPILAPHPVAPAVALAVLGGASALLDVAMNDHGVWVEGELGRPVMSSLHAGWAFGGMVGSAVAAAGAALATQPWIVVGIISATLIALHLVDLRALGEGSAPAAFERGHRFLLPPRAAAIVAAVCLLVMVSEGALSDWGGIYLRQDLDATRSQAALAYAFFTAGLFIGRLGGDALGARIGAIAVLRWGALLTVIALIVMLTISESQIALAGLALAGLGLANGVPLMFSAAGNLPGVTAGPAIAAVASMGSLGFLAGPPLIGFLSDLVSLRWALALLVVGSVAIFELAPRAARR